MKNKKDHKPMLNIKRPPKLGEIYWCRFPETIYPKEFGYGGKKHRPVIIFSRKNTLHGTALVIPLGTAEQTRPTFSVKMNSPIDGQDTWAVCSHILTVSNYRLCPDFNKGLLRVSHYVFQEIRKKVFANLPDER